LILFITYNQLVVEHVVGLQIFTEKPWAGQPIAARYLCAI
jgi:hypothetical protein